MAKQKSKATLLREQGKPVLPTKKQKEDPTKQGAVRKASLVDNAKRYRQIARDLVPAIQEFLRNTPREVIQNNIQVNKRQYNYDVDPISLAEITQFIAQTLQSNLDVDPNLAIDPNFWMSSYVELSYEHGLRDTTQSLKNISTPENVGEEESASIRQIEPEQIVADTGYQRRVGLLKGRTFESMKGLTAQSTADLADTLARGMVNGLGIQEITKNVVDRIGVSKRRAERIARTEVNNAYRTATRQEMNALNANLFNDTEYEMRLLWVSALSPTTRESHARRHGNTYTSQEVAAFYSVDGNAINCLCAQTPVLVDKKTGRVFQEEVVRQMKEEKKLFQ